MRLQFVAGAMALLLVACADIFPAPQTPAQAVFEAKAAFKGDVLSKATIAASGAVTAFAALIAQGTTTP